MIRYEFEHFINVDEEGNNIKSISRKIKEIYSDYDLNKDIEIKLNSTQIMDNLKSYYKGVAESGLLSIENDWYNNLKSYYTLIIKLEKLKNENEIINDEEITDTSDKIKKYFDNFTNLEAQFDWLKAYRGEETEVQRPEPGKTAEIPSEDLKKLIAYDRDQKVRSVEDSIADLAKMNSLLFSCISAMYGTMTETAKSKIDEGTKELIDYSVEKFSSTQTRADRQLMKEGTSLVDKLFDREVQIADIIDEVKGE